MASVESSAQNFAWAVKNPMTFVALNGNWSTQDDSVNYMWKDKNVGRYDDGKSIFDPSPLGWRLPILGTWSNFSTETFSVSESGRSYTAATAYYPNSGYRNGSTGSFTNSGSNGYFWSSTPQSTTNAYRLYFNGSSSVIPSYHYTRANGSPVRPIREN